MREVRRRVADITQRASEFRTCVIDVVKAGVRVQKRCHRRRSTGVWVQKVCHQCRAKDARVEMRCHRRRARVPDSHDGSPLSHRGFRIHTTCQRCRVKHARLENMSPTSFTSGLDSEEVPPMSRKACPDSDDVLPVKNSPVANFKQYGDHYDPLSAKHPSATYAAVTSPIEKNAPHQQTPVNAKRQVEVSEYAWRRLDEEKMNQYAIAPPSQDAEKETPPPVIKVTIPPAVKQPVEAEKQIGMANDQKGSSEKPDVPCEKEYKLPAESEYVAIPNDLYPAYRKATDYSSSVRVTAVPQSPDVVADDISCSDLDKCETAKENLPFRSRFKTLIEPKETRPVASSAPRYTIQHSPIGNAFSPVGQPQISEYQLEDLNDLASCIDAL
ncbi:unnamed protein product [Heligmosomoides polygyrus]|uniref:Uncharacterized protein n=1 Tax=Heligmosomoides polygyrus TaxID=6339 RepID=A0A183FMK3_HELPZ|nr:unnamed protein product [Heligmosomoides polygyrus]